MSLLRLFCLALLRVVAGGVDVVWLCTRPALLMWWWAAKRLPTYATAAADYGDDVYGDVFVAPTAALLRGCGARAGVVVFDVGCGAGHVLIAARSVGATARGVELDGARTLPQHARAAGADVVVVDGADVEYGDADIVWCSWLTWSVPTRAALTARLTSSMGSRALLVTLGYAPDGDAFEPITRTTIWCSWGRADVVISRRR